MKASMLEDLVKSGKQPMVRLTGALWDDSWGEKGMIARVVDVGVVKHEGDDDQLHIEFDYNENKAHNLALQSHEYYLREPGKKGTAFEAGMMKENDIHEGVYFMSDGDGSDVPVELIDSPILDEYVKFGSKIPYVAWLEAKLEELVPDAMKTWTNGLLPNSKMACPQCGATISFHDPGLSDEREATIPVVCSGCGQTVMV